MNNRQHNSKGSNGEKQGKVKASARKTHKILLIFSAALFLIPNTGKASELTLVRTEADVPVREFTGQENPMAEEPVSKAPTTIDFLSASSMPLALSAPQLPAEETEKAPEAIELKPADAEGSLEDGWTKSEEGLWRKGTTKGHKEALKFKVNLERSGGYFLSVSGRNRALFRSLFSKEFILDVYVDEVYVMSALLKTDRGKWGEASLPLHLTKGEHEIALGVTRLSPLPELEGAVFEYRSAVLASEAYEMIGKSGLSD